MEKIGSNLIYMLNIFAKKKEKQIHKDFQRGSKYACEWPT